MFLIFFGLCRNFYFGSITRLAEGVSDSLCARINNLSSFLTLRSREHFGRKVKLIRKGANFTKKRKWQTNKIM